MDMNYLLMKSKIKQEKKLVKLKKKYSHIKNFVKQNNKIYKQR